MLYLSANQEAYSLMLNLILFGPPGCGKGTQSDRLVGKYGLIHISTGNLLRQEIKDKTLLGLEAKSFIDKGQLVPDEVVIGMVGSSFDEHKDAKGFLFDGFPRNIPQAEALDRLLASKNTRIGKVLVLDVDEDELIRRLVNRGKTSGRSDDADEKIQRSRQDVYRTETFPVVNYYVNSGRTVAAINGMGEITDIFDRLSSHIDSELR